MSAVAGFLLLMSSSLVRDIYQRNFNPEATDSAVETILQEVVIPKPQLEFDGYDVRRLDQLANELEKELKESEERLHEFQRRIDELERNDKSHL
jgi:hypothetical protein